MNCKTCAGPCCLKGSNHEGDCEGYRPMSHYDQIRSMSVEEMADYLRAHSDSYWRYGMDWLDWLRQEVNDGRR